VLMWAAAAILAGTVTSWAVTVIGGESSGSSSTVLSEADVRAALATQTATPVPVTTPHATPTATASVAPSPTPTPTPTPVTTPTHRPTTPPPTRVTTPPAAPAPAAVVRFWDVTGGHISATCTGSTLQVYATPSDGWSVHVKTEGSTSAEVELRSGEQENTVYVACAAGIPTQSTHDTTAGDD